MDLKEFVAQTLSQIVSGVKETQTEVAACGGQVNPHLNASPAELGRQGFLNAGGRAAQIVQFDVALTVIEGTGTKGGIGVFAVPSMLEAPGNPN